jgi:hypothetical protein
MGRSRRILIALAAFMFTAFGFDAASLQASAHGTHSNRTLAPENHPSVVGVCSAPIIVGHNGSIAALFCHGSQINAQAWNSLAQDHSGLMTLGRSATWLKIVRASCQADNGTSTPAILAIYELTSSYNGWRYGMGPQRVLQLGTRSVCSK